MDIGYLAVDIPDGGLTPMNVESCFVIFAPPRALEQPVSQWAHMGPEGPSNFTKKLKGSVSAIFFFVAT